MKKVQWVRLGGVALVLGAAVVGCSSDEVTSPNAGPSVLLKRMETPSSTKPETVTVVTRRVPLPVDLVKTAVIDSRGGKLDFSEVGLRLIVPANAVSSAKTFKVTAFRGNLIAYDFEPSGTFAQPLRIEHDTKGLYIPTNATIIAGHFASRADLSNERAVGVLNEVRPITLEFNSMSGSKAVFTVDHFSGYLVASGRATRTY